MPTLTYRDATVADIAAIIRLCHAGDARGAATPALDESTLGDPRYAAALAEITADPRHRLVVAELEGRVVGTLQISILPGLPNFGLKRGLLENVHVSSDLRGGGYGSQLVLWAIEQCRAAGCGIVQLTSNKVRTDAHRFYRKLGFEQSHEGFKLRLG